MRAGELLADGGLVLGPSGKAAAVQRLAARAAAPVELAGLVVLWPDVLVADRTRVGVGGVVYRTAGHVERIAFFALAVALRWRRRPLPRFEPPHRGGTGAAIYERLKLTVGERSLPAALIGGLEPKDTQQYEGDMHARLLARTARA